MVRHRRAHKLRFESLEDRLQLAVDGPVISEFCASNATVLADEDGEMSDWIELYNPTDAPVSLDGWHLTDDATDLTKWTFPDRTLAEDEYLVLFASGKDRTGIGPDDELHASFSLDADGEYLALVEPDGVTISTEFAPEFPRQRDDIAYGSGWEEFDTLVTQGDPSRAFIPSDDSLGLDWTGDAASEPYNDSESAGWQHGPLGVGFDFDAVPVSQIETVGYSPVSRPTLDGAVGSIFVLESSPFTQPGELIEWTMFGLNSRSITPLILRVDDTPEYTITGIGQTRVSDASGEQQFAFELVSGSTEVGPGYFFAWKDGGNGTNNAGVAPFTNNTSQSVRWFQQHTSFAVDENLGSGESRLRTYSLQASAVLTRPPEPIGYWNFDDNVEDTSGNARHGVNNGAVFDDEVPPAVGSGRSLRFDGTDDFVSVLLDVSETAYTSAMWFKADAPGRGLFAVVNGDLGGSGHDRHIYLNGGNLATRVWNNQTIVTSGQNYADGAWHHVAHVFGAAIDGQRIYVDGELVASGTKASSDFNWQKRINIGFSNDAASDYFRGLIDEVAVWNTVLAEEQIQSLAQGTSPAVVAGYLPLIETDVGDSMYGVNASALLRVPFEVDEPVEFNSLLLRMKYDDGFVAWINGQEVLRRNAPMPLPFDAAATADRLKLDAIQYETFDLSAAIPVLRAGTNVLAVQGLNDAVDGTDFLIVPELLAANVTTNRYLSPPTPGEPNGVGVVDFVGDTTFTVDRGFYVDPFDVTIATVTPDAAIYYTLDGSIPAADNPTAVLYSGPLHVAETTILRAAAYKEDWQPSNVDTHTYLFPVAVADQPALPPGVPATWAGGYAADYEVDPDVVGTTLPGYGLGDALLALPAISLTTPPEDMFATSTGIYSNSSKRGPAWERAASVELIHPDGSDGFQIDAGARIQGNSSRNHGFTLKHSIRLLFKSDYGPSKLDYPLFPDSDVDRFDQLVLRSSSTDSWPAKNGNFVSGIQRWKRDDAQYIHDQWMRDSQVAMGHPSAHGVYVNLFINGLYWGQYNLAERPTDSFQAETFGGERDEYDIIKDYAELQSGTKDAWNQMISLASAGLASEEAYQRIQGNWPDGTPNPDYPNYLDVDALIDYMILHIYSGAEDWQKHNWWAARRRGPESEGFKFFVWDQEITNNSLVREQTHYGIPFENPISAPSPSFVYGQLMANDTYRWKFIDRVQEHLFNDGLLTAGASVTRWMARADETDQSIVGESARWGDAKRAEPFKREVEWLDQQEWLLNTYFQEIHPIAIQRFRNVGLYPDVEAPVFSQHGGQVAYAYDLTMTAPAGTIHYTTDGTDPRLADGSVAPGAIPYDGTPVALIDSGLIQARVLDAGEWSAVNSAFFFVYDPASALNFALTELNYHPRDPSADELAVDATLLKDDFEFVELANIGDTTIDLVGARFVDGIDFDFTTGSVTVLEPGQMAVVVSNATGFVARYGPDIPIAGQYTGSLRNSGESIELLDRFDQAIALFSYSDSGSWPGRADGPGSSLEMIDPAGDDADPDNWQSSTEYGGSPGSVGMGPLVDIVINEVLTHTDLPLLDSLELFNTTPGAIDLSGWFLSDSSGDYLKFQIPPGTVLDGGAYLVFDEDDFNTSGGVDPSDFAFSGSHGDDVWLMATDLQGKLTRFVDHVDFGAAANGESFGRWPNGVGKLYPSSELTLDDVNAPPRVGPVVMSEVHYNPGTMPEANDLEFVELHNPTDASVDLTRWELAGGIDYVFTPGRVMAPNEVLVVISFDPDDPLNVDRVAAFREAYGIDASVVLVGGYSGQLDNGGERFRLLRPDEPPLEEPDYYPMLLEDEVDYDDAAPWPVEADGLGQSLTRVTLDGWGHSSETFEALGPTPGTVDFAPAFTLDVNGNGEARALSDGIIILRYLFGVRGEAMVQGLLGGGATRTDPAEMLDYLDAARSTMLDVDASGTARALKDSIVILRYLFGVRGDPMIEGLIEAGATRTDPAAVTEHLDAHRPASASANATAAPHVTEVSDTPVVSEFMASNDTTLADVDGDYSDWIELHNPTDTTVALDGWYLTDDRSEPTKWRIPAVDLPANGYRLVFASDKDRTDPVGELHANFRLSAPGEYLALVMPDGVTVAHAFAPSYPEQLADISFGLPDVGLPDEGQYFLTPTPGAENTAGTLGMVADTRFSVDRGFHVDPFQVAVWTETPGAEIRYTTDGTAPTATTGSIYQGPIDVTTTTTLRAAAFRPGYLPTNVDTHTYFFLEDVLRQDGAGWPDNWGHHGADYATDPDVVDDPVYRDSIVDDLMSVASVSITMDPDDLFGGGGQGIYLAGTGSERPMSIEWIHPDGRQFQQNASVQIQGGTSTNRWKVDKLSMRVKFKEPYGPTKLEYPLFEDTPVEEFDTLILDAMMNLSWLHPDGTQRRMGQYVRDQYVCDLQNALSGHAPHGNYVHLYLDGLYWGLYWMHERPDETFTSSYLGGKKEDYDVLKHTSSTVVSGTKTDYQAMLALAAGDLSDPARYASFGQHVDIPNLIDYMITNFYVGNMDWAHHNWYASRNRVDPDGRWRFHTWDAEHVLKALGDDVTTKNNSGSPTYVHQRLRANAEYVTAFGDRVNALFFHDGLMTPDSAAAAYLDRLSQVDRAIVGESARWGDNRRSTDPYTRDDEWVVERDRLVNNYFPERTDEVLDQLRSRSLYPAVDAPLFTQQGGRITVGFDLGVTNPNTSGTVYYTDDGSDPRMPGGGISPDALTLTGSPTLDPIVLPDAVTISARVLDGADWSALEREEFFVHAPADSDNLAVTEVHYHPADPTAAELSVNPTFIDDDFEFLELMNVGDEAIDLGGARVVEGLAFDFDDALTTTLDPGQFVVIAANRTAFEARYGSMPSLAGEYTGRLDNGGEFITVMDRFDAPIVRFEYNDAGAWPGRADGGGSSLEVIDPTGTSTGGAFPDLSDSDTWRSSTEYEGSPGRAGMGPTVDVVINEVLTHTDSPLSDSIELHNVSDAGIDIGGWYLSDSSPTYRKFRVPDGTVIPAGGYLVFDEDDFNASAGVDPTDFALSGSHGDDVWLLAADTGGKLTRFVDHVEFRASANGESFGRWPNALGGLYPMTDRTFGSTNSGPRVGPLVLSEVMYAPADPFDGTDPDDLEFIEIHNPTDSPVPLDHCEIAGGIDYVFPPGRVLMPGGVLVVVPFDPDDPLNVDRVDRFRAAYGIDASVVLAGGYSGRLDNGGERFRLVRPDEPPPEEPDYYPLVLEDEVDYDDVAPWPIEADGLGQSLTRVTLEGWGHAADTFEGLVPTPGTVAFAPTSSLDVDGNGQARALSDGIIMLRYLFGVRGEAMVEGLLGGDATRTDPAEMAEYLDGARSTMLDVDADGSARALKDGIIVLRYLFGVRGQPMIEGLLGPGATRTDPAEIARHLDAHRPSPGAAALFDASSANRLLLDVATTPTITEFMADNETGLLDSDGDYSDWIELHNPTDSDIDLLGWHLTDDASNPTRWTFPATTLPADGYLVVFASGKNRTDPGNELHTNFGLSKSGEYLALVLPDGTTIAAEYTPEYPPQFQDVSHGLNAAVEDVLPIDPANCEFFSFPTPGEPNLAPAARAPSFSVVGGTFVTSFELTLASPSPDGVVRYTLDGSEPTSDSTPYTVPITIAATTMVRARAFEPGLSASPVVAGYFVAIDPAVAAFDSNLPLIVLDTFGSSLSKTAYITVAATVIDTGISGRASLTDAAAFTGRSGLKIRGSSSSNFPKKQYAFEIRGEDDEDLSAGLLGLPEESDWVLYAPYSDKTLMRNHLAYAWSNRIGQYATRTEFVEVFLNTNGEPITESDYVGVYVLIEKIKRDENRVDIEKLEPGDIQEPEISGGYIIKKDRLDPGDTGFTTTSGQRLAFVEPKEEEITPEQSGWLTGYFNEFEAALYGPNFTDPDTGYAKYIDVDSFIDHHILVETTKNIDGYRLSTFFYKDRGEKITAGPIWDYNLSLGNANYLTGWKTNGWYCDLLSTADYPWWRRLFEDPDFQQRYIDRWTELRRGPFQTDPMLAEIDAVAGLLEEGQVRNFDRWAILGKYVWPNWFIGDTYSEEIGFMKTWLTGRLAWIDSQYLTAPTFNQDGGLVSADFELDMSAPTGTIHFTLDGSDPRLPGGGISPVALPYSTPFGFARNTFVRARAFDGSHWSGPTEATFALVSPLPLAITELMYHPNAPEVGSPYTPGDFEFVELLNTGTQTVNLVNARFDLGIDFRFPTLDVAPGEYVVVASNLAAFATRYDTTGITLAGAYSGRLDDAGEQVRLVDAMDVVIDLFTYNDGGSWPGRADGKGSSLEVIDTSGDPNDPDHWLGSTEYEGSPGRAGMGPTVDVVINEVLTHTDSPLSDSIELHNVSDAGIDIGGWYLSDSSPTYRKFRVPDGTVIPAGGYLVFDEDDFNASAGVDPTDFALAGSHGDDVWLLAADTGGKLTRFVDHVEFRASANGESFGRWPNATGGLYPMTDRTFGSTNSGPRVGPLVLSEVMYAPADPFDGTDPDDLEFIEIHNPTDSPVPLDHCEIAGGIDYVFPPGRVLMPGGVLVVVPFDPDDPLNVDRVDRFRAAYGIDASVVLAGGYSGRLDNGGERFRLVRPDEPPPEEPDYYPLVLEDEVDYDDVAPWPVEADGLGQSLTRVTLEGWGHAADTFEGLVPTPGTVAFAPTSSLDVDGNGEARALSDGIIMLRYLFGVRGEAMVEGLLGGDATRTDPAEMLAYLDGGRSTMLDVDADGSARALKDGLIVLRYLFGVRGQPMIEGLLGPGAARTDPAEIARHLDAHRPPPGAAALFDASSASVDRASMRVRTRDIVADDGANETRWWDGRTAWSEDREDGSTLALRRKTVDLIMHDTREGEPW